MGYQNQKYPIFTFNKEEDYWCMFKCILKWDSKPTTQKKKDKTYIFCLYQCYNFQYVQGIFSLK